MFLFLLGKTKELTKPNAHCTAHWANTPPPKEDSLEDLLSSYGISSRFLLLYPYLYLAGAELPSMQNRQHALVLADSVVQILLNFSGSTKF